MSRTLTAADRRSLIRLASTLPVGSKERQRILLSAMETAPLASFAQDVKQAGDHNLRVRLASSLPKGSESRKSILGSLKEARGGWDKVVNGDRVRIKWEDGRGRPGTLVIEELPGKPFKRRLRKAKWPFPVYVRDYNYTSEAIHIPNIVQLARFNKGMTYDIAVMAMEAAVDAAIEQGIREAEESRAKYPDDTMRWSYSIHPNEADSLRSLPEVSDVYYLEVEPGDYKPLDFVGRDFSGSAEWTKFRMYRASQRDDYMSQMEGMRAFYQQKSRGGARKFYKLIKSLQKSGTLSGMTFAELERLLQKEKIAYDYVPTVWR